MMDRAEIRETLDKADELVTELKAFRNLSPESGNVTQFTVNAGGIGVWICATACIVMFTLTVVLGVLFMDLSRKYDRMQDHLSAIYMMAPSLKPADKAKPKE